MNTLDKYILLLSQFVTGEITASKFNTLYIKLFKNETEIFSEDIYTVLNNLFYDADAYCEDPSLRDDEDLNDAELLASAKKALESLV